MSLMSSYRKKLDFVAYSRFQLDKTCNFFKLILTSLRFLRLYFVDADACFSCEKIFNW